MHNEPSTLPSLTPPRFDRIVVALDFSLRDQKLIAYAIGQGNSETIYTLVHVVESVPARIYEDSDDLETLKDKEQLAFYVKQLKDKGLNAVAMIGYGNRAKEIVKMVHESNADMLVIGAHGHTGIKDFIYGETINTVRHELKIPVLIVHV